MSKEINLTVLVQASDPDLIVNVRVVKRNDEELLLRAASEVSSYSVERICGEGGAKSTRKVADVRKIVSTIMRESGMSLNRIGAALNTHHANALYLIKMHRMHMEVEPAYREMYQSILNQYKTLQNGQTESHSH